MPTSPSENSGKIPTFEILVDGRPLPDIFQVKSIVTDQSVNRISSATITLVLPSNDSGEDIFSGSDSDDFTPGNSIEIKLGYESENSPVFNGLISKLGIRNLSADLKEMVILCSGHAAKMALGQVSAYYRNMQDSAIIQTVAAEHGMDVEIDSTPHSHAQIAKYGVSDWVFVIARARANGMLVYEENKKLLVKEPATTHSRADLKIDFEIDVLQFNLGIDSRNKSETGQQTSPAHGSVTFQGNGKLKPNTMLEMRGFGKRFNGNALITSIKHKIKEGNWETTAGLGLPMEWQLKSGADASSNKQPSFSGLQTGTVKQIHDDPDLQYRILVDVPGIVKVEFNDEDKILTIKTPGGNQFALSDKDKSVTVKDMNGNALEMTTSGINLSSVKDILIKSNGNIILEAVSGVKATASGGDVHLEGLNVHAKADIAFSGKGSVSAELSASGQTTVKGAIVMIN